MDNNEKPTAKGVGSGALFGLFGLGGLQIIESPYLIEQFRFPRSKKKRIRAKWFKRPENNRPARHALHYGEMLICHPEFAARLRGPNTKDEPAGRK